MALYCHRICRVVIAIGDLHRQQANSLRDHPFGRLAANDRGGTLPAQGISLAATKTSAYFPGFRLLSLLILRVNMPPLAIETRAAYAYFQQPASGERASVTTT